MCSSDLDRWLTNFPPPPGFDGDEEGDFGDDDYWRELADDEQAALNALDAREAALLHAAAEVHRRRYFALDEAAEPAEIAEAA